MALNIVLVEPEIPNNTGNIGRLSLATSSTLHLVKPFGFELNDTRLKRAGLDYWQYLSVFVYEDFTEFMNKHSDKKFAYFSSHGAKSHWHIPFEENLFLVFGKESVGLPTTITQSNQKSLYQIPMYSEHIRSLNLANAVSIVVYEGLRQLAQ
ncbi:tRNA (cytidine(34)-2'-O)-methyltransferase [Croceitalea rosinachiae]|uniref:Putative tRNA (cytidine(34)-2'-O)-methyltransferase n=1 Tax=Croceitalea rosinachiae TaxID=3075596 RepID=A0ABU3A8K3_9FLAO|nr:tRNA (cytidine(34)-2'-O)-methyltransferase [Croceitalea sp. F388]MDT0605428.1 tRNA (cytidine(34)-2'-O)-methyltransferase [Croceitalea sp. F388]